MSDDNAVVTRDGEARPRPDSISSRDARDALERSLCSRLGACAADELRVLDAILLRLELGRDRYGALDLTRDRRDWAREEAEEQADALVYRACALISRQDQERRELRAAAGRELVEAGLTELVTRAPSVTRTPAVNFAWDMTDEGEG